MAKFMKTPLYNTIKFLYPKFNHFYIEVFGVNDLRKGK